MFGWKEKYWKKRYADTEAQLRAAQKRLLERQERPVLKPEVVDRRPARCPYCNEEYLVVMKYPPGYWRKGTFELADTVTISGEVLGKHYREGAPYYLGDAVEVHRLHPFIEEDGFITCWIAAKEALTRAGVTTRPREPESGLPEWAKGTMPDDFFDEHVRTPNYDSMGAGEG